MPTHYNDYVGSFYANIVAHELFHMLFISFVAQSKVKHVTIRIYIVEWSPP